MTSDPFEDIEPRLVPARPKGVVEQLRDQGLETMNRQCRRHHKRFWQTKDIASGIRLVRCNKCNGQTYERMQ